MTTTLGWRKVFGVMTPTINTVVQPEYDAMRPAGVVNHVEGIVTQDRAIGSDKDLDDIIAYIDTGLEDAVKRAMSCRPDHLILGLSAESIWGGGNDPGRSVADRVKSVAGPIGFTQATEALPAALKRYGIKRNVSIIGPYYPVAEQYLRSFMDVLGYSLTKVKHLCCKGVVEIAFTTEQQLREALYEVDGPEVEAIVQFGANLPMGRLADEAERWLGKPVIAVNTATYWHALRTCGINDKVQGFGRLLSEF